MRDASDLVNVRVTTTRDLMMDLEQLEQSPMFRSIEETLQSMFPIAMSESPMAVRHLAVRDYILEHLASDSFPFRTPGTTGPGSLHTMKVEVLSNDTNSNPNSPGSAGSPCSDAGNGTA